jgi:trimethylamine--corrinoid protein Co-methyltransferase
MALNGFTRRFKPLELLSEEQVEEIHRASLDVLEETGIRLEHEKALSLFEKNGAKVDFEEKRVRIPPGLVEECLGKCPSSFRMKSRDPNNDLIIGGNTVYFGSFPGMQSVDLDTWEQRTVSREEYYQGVTILDALDNVHAISNYTPYFGFEGVPPVMSIPESVAARLRNSTKCIGSGSQEDCEIFTINMAKELDAEVLGQCSCSPPLAYYNNQIESVYRFIKSNNPIQVISGISMGATGPSTIIGSIVSNTAELMAGVTLTQLIKPGSRVMVMDFALQQNMRTGSPFFGAIGNSIHQVVFNQIWREYRIPTKSSIPGPSNSKKIDFQCGYEKALSAMTAALSGSNVIFLHGCIYGELAFHPLQAILDDDIAGMIGHFIEGVKVDNETVALDLIEEVGPIPGFYLDKEHTRKWWKNEQFIPKAADMLTYPEWMEGGKKDCLAYARDRMKKILGTHKVSIPLTGEQDMKINNILKEAYNYYKNKGLIK